MKEQTKNYLGWAIIAGVLLVGIALLSMAVSYAKSIQPSAYRTFQVSADGKAVAVPDVAQFTFTVISEGGTDVAALQRDNTTKVNKAVDFLKAQNVDEEDIKTESYNVSPRYSTCVPGVRVFDSPASGTVCPPASIVGYSINHTTSVKLRDFAKVGPVLAGVVQNGANSVSQLNFTIDDPTQLENEAREEAIAKAKDKAEAIADAGNFRIGRLLSIQENGYYPYYYGKGGGIGLDAAMSEPREVIPPTIAPGSQEVNVSMILTYEIK